jgi:hypothetical protein
MAKRQSGVICWGKAEGLASNQLPQNRHPALDAGLGFFLNVQEKA